MEQKCMTFDNDFCYFILLLTFFVGWLGKERHATIMFLSLLTGHLYDVTKLSNYFIDITVLSLFSPAPVVMEEYTFFLHNDW